MNFDDLLIQLSELPTPTFRDDPTRPLKTLALEKISAEDLRKIVKQAHQLVQDEGQEEESIIHAARALALKKEARDFSLLLNTIIDWQDHYLGEVLADDFNWILKQLGADAVPEALEVAKDQTRNRRSRTVVTEALGYLVKEEIMAEEINASFIEYLSELHPDRLINSFFIANLINNDVSQANQTILAAYDANVVDITLNGPKEMVERDLGLRDTIEHPVEDLFAEEARLALDAKREELGPMPDTGDPVAFLDYLIRLYQRPEGVVDISMLDGLLLVIIASPVMAPPSALIHLPWDCQNADPKESPVFDSMGVAQKFSTALMEYYNTMIEDLDSGQYVPALAFYGEDDESEVETYLGTWVAGLYCGVRYLVEKHGENAYTKKVEELALKLVPQTNDGKTFTEAQAARLLGKPLELFYIARADQQKNPLNFSGSPMLSATSTEPVVRETPKVGRNSPCPCGSGKKYKRCCAN